MIKIRRNPRCRGMAIVTRITTRYVCRVFARRNRVVMTRYASTENLRVVDTDSRTPQIRRMAIFTNVRRINVCWAFAGRITSVVAADTVP